VFYFVAAGGILGLLLNQWTGSDLTAVAFDRQDLVFPAAGLAGGFIYWLIVGRLSGRFNLAAASLPPVREDQPDGKGAEHPGEQPVDQPRDAP